MMMENKKHNNKKKSNTFFRKTNISSKKNKEKLMEVHKLSPPVQLSQNKIRILLLKKQHIRSVILQIAHTIKNIENFISHDTHQFDKEILNEKLLFYNDLFDFYSCKLNNICLLLKNNCSNSEDLETSIFSDISFNNFSKNINNNICKICKTQF